MANASVVSNNSSTYDIGDYCHPDYVAMQEYWTQLNDFYDNDVKSKTVKYLPMTSGQINDKKNGNKRYLAYLNRTVYYNFTKQTVRDSKNVIVRKPATFEVPNELQYMLEFFNNEGQDIHAVLDDTLAEQIKLSRLGRLIDIANINGQDRFQSIEYKALSILSWNEQEMFAVGEQIQNLGKRTVYILLNESDYEINQDGQFEYVNKYRVLGLRYSGDSDIFRYYTITLYDEEVNDIKYFVSPDVFDLEYVLSKYGNRYIEPNFQGSFLNILPFSFINLDCLRAAPDIPILWDQLELSKALYQKNANYSEIEMLQTINTTVITGDDGSGATFYHGGVYKSTSDKTKVDNIGFDGQGLSEIRESQQNLKRDCQNFGGVVVSQKNVGESGAALETRVTLATDKLRDISKNGVAGIVEQLRIAALWGGYNIEEVVGIANEDFRTEKASTEDLTKVADLFERKLMTEEDYYKYNYDNAYTSFGFDEFKEKLVERNDSEPDREGVQEENVTNVSDESSDNVVEN